MKIPRWPLLLGPTLAFGIGFAMNAIVMAANHGQMPVLLPGGSADGFEQDIYHTAMVAGTHLKFLADWIVIRGLGVASIGDFFLWAGQYATEPGLFLWAALVIHDHNHPQS